MTETQFDSFIQAVLYGNDQLVEQWLQYNKEWANETYGSSPPLLLALEKQEARVTECLLKFGANYDVKAKDKGRTPALLMAVRGNFHEGVRLLLNAGADVNCSDIFGETPLLLAIALGHQEIVLSLVQGGANVNHANAKTGCSPLTLALRSRNVSIVECLIKHGADVNEKGSKTRESPLFRTISLWSNNGKDQCKILRLLLDRGASVHEAESHFQDTALMRAVYLGCVEAIELLIGRGAQVHAANILGDTPFYRACRIGDVSIIYALIRKRPQMWLELSEILNERPCTLVDI